MNDLRLIGAMIADGTGEPMWQGDVAVRDGRIVGLNADADGPAVRAVDVGGMVVAPGFIDLHTHVDFTLPAFPRAPAMVRQGVTTLVGGNCGFSPFPVDPARAGDLRDAAAFFDAGLTWDWDDAGGYLRMLDGLPLACNAALLVGHGAVHIAAMGFEPRAPDAGELDRMRRMVGDALAAGVFGMSSGLAYSPGEGASTDEIVALAEVTAAAGAFYASHIRGEGDRVEEAVAEAIEIGQRSGAAVQLSHHKAMGRNNWGKVGRTLAMIDAARSDGLDVMADQYPYTAASTTLSNLLPYWARHQGLDGMLAMFDDPAHRARLAADVRDGVSDHDIADVMISAVPPGPNIDIAGRMLVDVAAERGEMPTDLLFRLLAEERDRVQMVVFGMDEDDVQVVMRHPQVAVASDGWTLDPSVGGVPHPRSYGTFVRVLGRYVREWKVVALEEAIRKMTALPASRLGLTDRGVVRPGAWADLVVFDPDRVVDTATFDDPHQFCDGVHMVVVNGQVVIDDGRDTGAEAGVVLRAR